MTVGGIEPGSYSLSLNPIDGLTEPPLLLQTTFTRGIFSLALSVVKALPRRRLWGCKVLASTCSENPVTDSFELSKYSRSF